MLGIYLRLSTALTIALLAASGCVSSDLPDPGPSGRGFEYTLAINDSHEALVILVIDDRATPEATQLRSEVSAALLDMVDDVVGDTRDPGLFVPIDLKVLLVGASSTRLRDVLSPATDASLAWTTQRATREGGRAWAAAVGARAVMMTSTASSFRPLERAQDVFRLMSGSRIAQDDAEAKLAAIAFPSTVPIGVSVLASSDDESPHEPESYALGDDLDDPMTVTGLITPHAASSGYDTTPRLRAWVKAHESSLFGGCRNQASTHRLFGPGLCTDYADRCDPGPIAEVSPGVGACRIEITTTESECSSSRGWADPRASDGGRDRQTTDGGMRVCEALPVAPSGIEACMHDPSCDGCGSGWCLSDVQPKMCGSGVVSSRSIRWVGRVLPKRGRIHIVCRER